MGNRVISQELIDLGERIRKRRQELQWSQEKLAEIAGISLNTVSRVEGGQSDMSIEVFRKIVGALGTNASEVLGDAEPVENGKLHRLLYRIQHLDLDSQRIVIQTLETLVDGLYQCRK